MVIDLEKFPARLTQKQRAEHIVSLVDSFLRCDECSGQGYYEVDKPVVDYTNGGFLDAQRVKCEHCNGDGEITELEQLQ